MVKPGLPDCMNKLAKLLSMFFDFLGTCICSFFDSTNDCLAKLFRKSGNLGQKPGKEIALIFREGVFYYSRV